ncbi:unnamed protein product [Blepharisma stoltei]|uniref:Uncharacterized protein n=1 Tax=Blepharisma stoltei TaxID=1481888 RepID=A0AAU9JUA9_9CILI|nr:unnamed protein product [Blepharisma stoltei]
MYIKEHKLGEIPQAFLVVILLKTQNNYSIKNKRKFTMVDHLTAKEYKIAVIGSTGVGKSSLCMQFTRNRFEEAYEPTIEDYYRKQVTFEGEQIIFDIIDTAGEEGNLTNLNGLIRQAVGYLLVYDITRRQSYSEAKEFRDRVLYVKNAISVPMVLVGNKADMEEKREISFEEATKDAADWSCSFFEVSAKTKTNLESAFAECAKSIKRSQNKRQRDGGQKCCLLL